MSPGKIQRRNGKILRVNGKVARDCCCDESVAVAGWLAGSPVASVWRFLKGSQTWTYDTGNGTEAIALDAAGNVYVGGFPAGSPAKNVWKLDAEGNLLWDFCTESTRRVRGIAVDASGNVYVVGQRPPVAPRASVWKLNPDGTQAWQYDTGESTRAVAVDPSGNVLVAGTATSVKTFWKLNSSGSLLWSMLAVHRAVASDSEGNIYLAGNWSRTPPYHNTYKYDPDGNLIWGHSTGQQTMLAIAVDADKNVYVAGARAGTPLKNVWKLDADGNAVWDYYTGGPYMYGVALDREGNVFVAGDGVAWGDSVWQLDQSGAFLWGAHPTTARAIAAAPIWLTR